MHLSTRHGDYAGVPPCKRALPWEGSGSKADARTITTQALVHMAGDRAELSKENPMRRPELKNNLQYATCPPLLKPHPACSDPAHPRVLTHPLPQPRALSGTPPAEMPAEPHLPGALSTE